MAAKVCIIKTATASPPNVVPFPSFSFSLRRCDMTTTLPYPNDTVLPSSPLNDIYYSIQLDSESDNEEAGIESEEKKEKGDFEECLFVLDEEYSILEKQKKKRREEKKEEEEEERRRSLEIEFGSVPVSPVVSNFQVAADYTTTYLKLREMEKKIRRELHYLEIILGMEMRLCPLCIKETFSTTIPPTPLTLQTHLPLLQTNYPNLYCTNHGASLGHLTQHLLSK